MPRFTIRDVLWLMVVVGLLIAWSKDHKRRQEKIDEARILMAPVAMCANPTEVGQMRKLFYDRYGRWPAKLEQP